MRDLRELVPSEFFLSQVMQHPDATAFGALLKMGDEKKVDLRSLLPATAKSTHSKAGVF